MNHYDAQIEFERVLDGTLDGTSTESLHSHLSSCETCRLAFEEYRTVWELQRELAGSTFEAPEGFDDLVMQELKLSTVPSVEAEGTLTFWSKVVVRPVVVLSVILATCIIPSPFYFRFVRNLGGHGTLLLFLALVVIVGALYFVALSLRALSLLLSGTRLREALHVLCSWKGLGSASFFMLLLIPLLSVTQLGDHDYVLRQLVNNLFLLIEGRFGALAMLGFLLLAFAALFYHPHKTAQNMRAAGGFLSVAVVFFLLRSSVSLFFGAEFEAYEPGSKSPSRLSLSGGSSSQGELGGGPNGSYSEAAYDDSLMRFSSGSAVGVLSSFSSAVGAAAKGVLNSAEPQVSTFSIDVDTGSYTYVRGVLNASRLPDPDDVRLEEFLNYFRYDYPPPQSGMFAVNYELARSPLNETKHILRIGVKAAERAEAESAGRSFVFVIDVSGSMDHPDKLPLLKESLQYLVNDLRSEDRIAIVTYASGNTVLLPSTSGDRKEQIHSALAGLQAAGGTNGSDAIVVAYQIALENFIPNGRNRIVLATDGDFNQGITDLSDLISLIEHEREKGVRLTTLGFGMTNYRANNLEQLADHGNGNYFYIDSLAEAKKVLVTDLAANFDEVAADTKIQVEFNSKFVKSAVRLGYENRALQSQDFRDGGIDAGEVGAGQTVTALFELELTEAGKLQQVETNSVDPLLSEYGYLRIRYKDSRSAPAFAREEEFPIRRTLVNEQSPSHDFKFTVAVAAFAGMLKAMDATSADRILKIAEESVQSDSADARREFLALIRKYRETSNRVHGMRYGKTW